MNYIHKMFRNTTYLTSLGTNMTLFILGARLAGTSRKTLNHVCLFLFYFIVQAKIEYTWSSFTLAYVKWTVEFQEP